ncbi:GNAT family N-acetyltransferase [Roseomonas populi]|uniref:GNAT family N-acetyltransferase n=1 Tax=Roseomonas populi TaxID=3121582 RepID=A0ABT1X981_9PROT|nr:GNAT family N-acetyltransferase [Roseomonas pecuniae]MCR0984668.1 GNAT family N-acetyltransferase [Roseomonas pecuniae]
MAPGVILRRATGADLAYVMAVEATPGHDAFINAQPREEHEAQLATPAFAYFVAEAEGDPVGFAILSDMTELRGNRCLKRLALARPGGGLGRPIFRVVTDWAFANTPAHRFWLHALHTNLRAIHLYASEGFTEEGRLRQARPREDGTRADLVLMSMLRPEWEARRAA